MSIRKTLSNIPQLLSQYKTPIFYSGGSLAKAFAQIISGFIIARFISPNDFGLWTTLNLAVTYSFFLQAGLINGLNLELPYAYGKGEDDKAKIMAATVQTFTIFSSIFILIIAILCFLFIPINEKKIKNGIFAITLIIIFTYYQNYLTSTFRSKSSFLKLSYIQLIDALMNLISLLLVIYYAYYGMIVRSVLVIFIDVLLLHFLRPIKVGLIWNKPALLKLLKVGLPIFGFAYLESSSSTADKLWLLKFSNLTDVGLYTFGFSALTVFSLFSLSIATYIYPRMTYSYGKNNDKTILWQYVKKITIILIVIQTPLAIIGYFMIPKLITPFFPKYILSISAMQILLFAGIFKGGVVGVNALWSIKKWKYIALYEIFYSFLLVSLPYIGIRLLYNKINGVAYGILFANIINFISGILLTYLATKKQ